MAVIDKGSNTMTTYQAIMSALTSNSDSLTLMLNSTTLVATITNVVPVMQPVRIQTNALLATTAVVKVYADWKDPKKRVHTSDILTLVSASGTVLVSVLLLADIGVEVAAGIAAFTLASDIQSVVTQFASDLAVQLSLPFPNNFVPPVSTAGSNLYWSSLKSGAIGGLATYDEIMSDSRLFACFKDNPSGGWYPSYSPIPGSITPVDATDYVDSFCGWAHTQDSTHGDMAMGFPVEYCDRTQSSP